MTSPPPESVVSSFDASGEPEVKPPPHPAWRRKAVEVADASETAKNARFGCGGRRDVERRYPMMTSCPPVVSPHRRLREIVSRESRGCEPSPAGRYRRPRLAATVGGGGARA